METPYFSVSLDTTDRVVFLKRTASPFPSGDECEHAYKSVAERLEHVGGKIWRLLVDLRDAPARNDAPFEFRIAEHRRRMVRHFIRTACVVKTAAGRIQVKRHMREDGFPDIGVFMNEAEALAYLRAENVIPSRGMNVRESFPPLPRTGLLIKPVR